MKTIALTIWGNRISPVFASARQLMVVRISQSDIVNRSYEAIQPEKILSFIDLINRKEISVLLCGAITKRHSDVLEKEGILLIPFVTGRFSNVLDSYLIYNTLPAEFFMPGHGHLNDYGHVSFSSSHSGMMQTSPGTPKKRLRGMAHRACDRDRNMNQTGYRGPERRKKTV